MRVTFKRHDSAAEQTIDVLPNSKLGESREAAQMLLGLPENISYKLTLERTVIVLEDSLTFEEAGIQDKDKLILSLPTEQEIKSPQAVTQPFNPAILPLLTSLKSSSSSNWPMAVITGSVVGIFVLAAIFINNFNNYLSRSQPTSTSIPAPSPTPIPAPVSMPSPTVSTPTSTLIPTPIPTSSRTPIPVPSSEANETNATIIGDSKEKIKNIRSGPGTSNEVTDKIAIGSRVKVLSEARDSGDYSWYKIHNPSSGKQGWIAGQFVDAD